MLHDWSLTCPPLRPRIETRVRFTFSGRDKQPNGGAYQSRLINFTCLPTCDDSSSSPRLLNGIFRLSSERTAKKKPRKKKNIWKYFPCDLRLHVCVQQKMSHKKLVSEAAAPTKHNTTQCKGFNDLGAARKSSLVVFYLGAQSGQSAVCVRSPTRFMGLVWGVRDTLKVAFTAEVVLQHRHKVANCKTSTSGVALDGIRMGARGGRLKFRWLLCKHQNWNNSKGLTVV